MWLTKNIHDTWKVVKGMSSFNFDLISLLYDRICLRTDVLKINYCLNILFII